MDVRTRRSMVVAAAVGLVGAALAVIRCDRTGEPAAAPAARAAAIAPGTPGVAPSSNRPAPAPAATADRIEIAGSARTSISSAELADRPGELRARDRRAWRLSELIPDTYMRTHAVIHALTIEGRDYILRGTGRGGDDVIVVRRNTGELYLGWLDGAPHDTRPLADAERPGERIAHVARITAVEPAPAQALAPPRLTILVDGVARQTLTADSFTAAARLKLRGPRDGAAPAIDIARAFGGGLEVAGLIADGAAVTTAPPSRDARAVIYMNRRARFKFAWIDRSGQRIPGTQQREVSQLSLRRIAR